MAAAAAAGAAGAAGAAAAPLTGALSAASRFVLSQAVAPSTRRTYAAPLRSYAEFCKDIGQSGAPEHITVFTAGEWLAHLALGGTISGGTLKTYRSALSTAWEEAGGQGANPLQAGIIERHLRGASRILLSRDLAKRAARERTIDLTPMLLGQLLPKLEESLRTAMGTHNPVPLLCWAAACFGVYGLLRPSEFLSVGYARYTSFLSAGAVRFYAAPGLLLETGLLPPDHDLQDYPVPDRFSFALGPTKADQLARNDRVVIAAPMCVQAVWRWMHARRRWGHAPEAPLFVCEDGKALSRPQLIKQLQDWLVPVLGYAPKITGRCFRRGGASAMLQGGAAVPAIMNAGRWKSAAMVGVYASKEAQRARAAEESRAMDPPEFAASVEACRAMAAAAR